jgi:Zn-dependent M28 family amino/carboxypeptidase
VFVGYGVVAPEYNWNDYAGVDVKGKIVVVLINDPGFLTNDTTMFKGRAMTYYGRWVYKFEEAARQGAAGVIIVHETVPAAYGWQVVRNSNSGGRSYIDVPNQNANRVKVQSWITYDQAKALFARARMDYDKLKIEANRRGFKARRMGRLTASIATHSTVTRMTTRNVIGIIRGSRRPDEYVLYTAHWDHIGVKPDVAGDDKLYNGAVDNATGTSGMLEIAEAFAKGPKPQRSVAFLAVTLEEQGLLGSEYFAANPVMPLNRIVGGINFDAGLPVGRAHDMIVIGSGASELEDLLAAQLRTQNRVITGDPEPEKGGFYRSDHISLSKVGVPMLYPAGGYNLINGGTAAGQAARDDYRTNRYHQPTDEFDPNWDVSGPVSDFEIAFGVGKTLANSDTWPNWYNDNEFRAIRDKSRAAQ